MVRRLRRRMGRWRMSDLVPGSLGDAAKLPGLGERGSALDRLVARYVRQLLALGLSTQAAAKSAWLAAQRAGRTGEAMTEPLTQLTVTSRARAVEMAQVFLRAAAREQGVDLSGVDLARPPELDPTRAARAFGYAGPGVLGLSLQRLAEQRVAERRAADAVAATAERFVLGAAREAVVEAVEAPGVRSRSVSDGWGGLNLRTTRWARVTTSLRPCAFCVMLASRGAVYKSEASAFGFNASQYHDNCHCIVVPIVEGGEPSQQSATYYRLWQQATSGYSGRSALKAFRSALRKAELRETA